jgi:hypothetical protein
VSAPWRCAALLLAMVTFFVGVPRREPMREQMISSTVGAQERVVEVFVDQYGYPDRTLEVRRTVVEAYDVTPTGVRRSRLPLSPAEREAAGRELGIALVPPQRAWNGRAVAANAAVGLVLGGVTFAWHLLLLGWRPSRSWPAALMRVAAWSLWPAFVGWWVVEALDPVMESATRGQEAVRWTATTTLVTTLLVAALLVLAHVRGRLVARHEAAA